MLSAPLFSQTRDMLRQRCFFQNRGTWQKYHCGGRCINSESYRVHIEIRLDFLEAGQIHINYPDGG